jgi:5'-3' exonuclease
MGIAKFFNSIKKSYGAKIITTINNNTYLPNKYFLIDFNSIIHNISQSITSSIIFLYHMYLISILRPDIFNNNKSIILHHLMNISTNESLILNAEINLPDIKTDDINDKYMKSIDFRTISIEDIDESFFRLLNEKNLDSLIIHKVASYISQLINYFPNLLYIYLAVDGVPMYSKMVEQKKRRFMSMIQGNIRSSLLELYKNELNVEPNKDKNIYYNHYEFEKKIINFKFNKGKISPGTSFMTELESYLDVYLNNNHKNIIIIIDSYTSPGEGEKKIVFKIHQLYEQYNNQLSEIMVYSPDADVILLMLMELDKCNIQIMRYDQQLNHIDIINITRLKSIIINYLHYNTFYIDIQHNIIKDIVMLFTILGNDFLPKLELINTNKHIHYIIDAYKSLNQNIKSTDEYKYIFIHNINWLYLKKFFIILYHNISSNEQATRRSLHWFLNPNQIINTNAIHYYRHIFNIENLTNIYDPNNPHNKNIAHTTEILSDKEVDKCVIKYLQGFVWLTKYYLDHDIRYKFFYYKYKKLSIPHIISNLEKFITNKNYTNKLITDLNKTIISDADYFIPIEQLIFISPYNVSNIIDRKYIHNNKIKKLIDKYDLTYNIKIEFISKNHKINIFDYFECDDVMYLTKCELKHQQYISGRTYLNILRQNIDIE